MERLTEKHYLGTDHYMKCSGNCNVDMDCIDCPSFDCLVERLAAYEDTGLTPERCAEFARADAEGRYIVEKQACLTREEIVNYLKGTGYGWHISDLLIYDQPRELSEFQRATDPCVFCMERIARECTDRKKWGGDIKRPPQSWCYVEEG